MPARDVVNSGFRLDLHRQRTREEWLISKLILLSSVLLNVLRIYLTVFSMLTKMAVPPALQPLPQAPPRPMPGVPSALVPTYLCPLPLLDEFDRSSGGC
jgi:hypothetical protein